MGHGTIEHVVDFEKRSAIKSQVLHYRLDGAIRLYRRHSSRNAMANILRRSLGSILSWGCSDTEITISIRLRYAARLQFTAEVDMCSNNIAKYEAILLGLHKLQAMGV
jgi:hypothetical protein